MTTKPSTTNTTNTTDDDTIANKFPVPDGWIASCWADRLLYLADACRAMFPVRADEYTDAARAHRRRVRRHQG